MGFIFRGMGEGFGGIAPRRFRRLRDNLGLRFRVLVLVLELGFGVYFSELRFTLRRNSASMVLSPAGWLQRFDGLCFGSQGLMHAGSKARTCVSGSKV